MATKSSRTRCHRFPDCLFMQRSIFPSSCDVDCNQWLSQNRSLASGYECVHRSIFFPAAQLTFGLTPPPLSFPPMTSLNLDVRPHNTILRRAKNTACSSRNTTYNSQSSCRYFATTETSSRKIASITQKRENCILKIISPQGGINRSSTKAPKQSRATK